MFNPVSELAKLLRMLNVQIEHLGIEQNHCRCNILSSHVLLRGNPVGHLVAVTCRKDRCLVVNGKTLHTPCS